MKANDLYYALRNLDLSTDHGRKLGIAAARRASQQERRSAFQYARRDWQTFTDMSSEWESNTRAYSKAIMDTIRAA